MPNKEILYPESLSIRLDTETMQDLEVIATYEKTSRSTLARHILVEKTQTYGRRPDFKAWRKRFERRMTGDVETR